MQIHSFSITDRGKVRTLIFDIDSSDYEFEDNEIDALLEQNSDSVWLAAADACRSLATKYAKKSFKLRIPGALEIDKKKVSKFYLDLATSYERRATGSVDFISEFWDSFDVNIDILGQDDSEYVGDP